MYSYEERIRVVELYIKLGKRVAATIHQLGYPTENALKSWHREYEQCLDLPRGYLHSKPKYSQAQMKLAVDHYLENGRCIAATTKALGYPARDSLRAWIQELHPELHTHTRCRQICGATARASAKAGGGPRVVHSTRECQNHCANARRVQADVVQLEESATRS